MLTFVDIVKRWAYEHYPIETLGMIELAVTLNEDGSPREVLLEGYQVQLSVASPTFFSRSRSCSVSYMGFKGVQEAV